MPREISERCKKIKPSATLALSAHVNSMKAAGIDVIGMAAGEPDFDTPDGIAKAAIEAICQKKTRYTPVSGIPALRSEIAENLKAFGGRKYTTDEIIVCAGAKQALSQALNAILNTGDEVLLPTPCWVSYPEMIKLAGGTAVPVPTTLEQGYVPGTDQLEAAVTEKTKAIIINSPNNPTGAVWTRQQLTAVCEFARKYDLWIISDEIYRSLVYGDAEHVSVPTISRDAFERTILIDGFSKSYAMTGWRIGFAAGRSDVIKAMSSFQSQTSGNANSITQYAALAALKEDPSATQKMYDSFAERRELIVSMAGRIPGVRFAEPKGAFYLFMDVGALLPAVSNGKMIMNAADFAQDLLENEFVAVVPGGPFGDENCLRLSFAISNEQITEAMRRIGHYTAQLKKPQAKTSAA